MYGNWNLRNIYVPGAPVFVGARIESRWRLQMKTSSLPVSAAGPSAHRIDYWARNDAVGQDFAVTSKVG